jgi:arsenate reductase
MYTLFGIKNCDKVKKAITSLKENQIDSTFHDYKKSGITEDKLNQWIKQIDWESLVNKQGTSWKKLDKNLQTQVIDAKTAIALMIEKTSVIKRPLLEKDGKIIALGLEEVQNL